jgi:virulence factor BrkB
MQSPSPVPASNRSRIGGRHHAAAWQADAHCARRSCGVRARYACGFAELGILFALVAMGRWLFVPLVLNFIGVGGATEMMIEIARWPAYRNFRARVSLSLRTEPRKASTRQSPGSSFRFYLPGKQNFGSFNKTYGSLGAIIGFMLWIWLSTTIVLIAPSSTPKPSNKPSAIRPRGDQSRWGLAAREWRTRSRRRRSDCLGPCGSVGFGRYCRAASNVLQLARFPDFRPVVNQWTRCAEEPCVKASGTT